MHTIHRRRALTPLVTEFVVEAPLVAQAARAGQFVVVRLHARGERIPLTLADWDPQAGTVTLVVQQVGKTTQELGNQFGEGDALQDVVGPLGEPTETEKLGTVVCVAGGVGIAPIYPIARALRAAGNRVVGIAGARSRDLLFWLDRLAAVTDELVVCTDDGSFGRKGLVTQPLAEILAARQVDRVWAIGPAVMMKFCSLTCQKQEVPIIVSLNPIMVDGTGMCGACRVEVDGQVRFACVEGPEFRGERVNWDLLIARLAAYRDQEKCALDRYREAMEEATR
ncbi:MAG: sulfide/dihydroorotate dehydrogenase-like FAD/NAD-binding protein [Candidatus Bipolaricaulaceae bacterium]